MVVVMGIEIPGIQFQYQNRKYTEEMNNQTLLNKQSESNKKRKETNEKIEQLMNSTETGNQYE
jgi:hypothetical protein